MAYSEAKIIAGGLAHIPVIIGFFGWFKGVNLRRHNAISLTKAKTPSEPSQEIEVFTSDIPKETPSSELKPDEKPLNADTNTVSTIDSSQVTSQIKEQEEDQKGSTN